MKISAETRNYLLRLARESIESVLHRREVTLGKIPAEAREKAGIFVTLTTGGELRGCIGMIEPVYEIYRGVLENAQKAAFSDPRFPSVAEYELLDVRIEISILSIPRKIELTDEDELLTFLAKNKPGLILRRENMEATFLPQVWEDVPDPSTFLDSLCQKAGLSSQSWRETGVIEYFYYTVTHFSEGVK